MPAKVNCTIAISIAVPGPVRFCRFPFGFALAPLDCSYAVSDCRTVFYTGRTELSGPSPLSHHITKRPMLILHLECTPTATYVAILRIWSPQRLIRTTLESRPFGDMMSPTGVTRGLYVSQRQHSGLTACNRHQHRPAVLSSGAGWCLVSFFLLSYSSLVVLG